MKYNIIRKFFSFFYIIYVYVKYREPKVYRANGEIICKICGKKYYDHPIDKKELLINEYHFLNILCNSDRVHL
jgi:hypothetical protein